MKTKQAYSIPQIDYFEYAKDDGGEAGTFAFHAPLRQAQLSDVASQIIMPYAAVAGAMDVIAIYATRSVVEDGGTAVLTIPIGPSASSVSSITWGSPQMLSQLQSPSCVFIGMVDNATGAENAQEASAELVVSGRDMTKVFYENDTNLPDSAQAALFFNPGTPFNTLALVIDSATSGTQLLESALDLMVAKQIPSDLDSEVTSAPGGTTAFDASLQSFGFPWRNFVSTSKLNPSFINISGPNAIPPYSMNSGSAWANMDELRNTPVARLFVDETASLIFDFSSDAWVTQPVTCIINEIEVGECDIWEDDAELVTVIQTWPMAGLAGDLPLAQIKGVQGAATFVTQIAAPVYNAADIIANYGYRLAAFQSFWDITIPQANQRQGVLAIYHNSINFAKITVRGRPVYKVGTRVQLNVPWYRPAVTNASWYITGVSSQATFGEDWVTQLSLRFPMDSTGLIH